MINMQVFPHKEMPTEVQRAFQYIIRDWRNHNFIEWLIWDEDYREEDKYDVLSDAEHNAYPLINDWLRSDGATDTNVLIVI